MSPTYSRENRFADDWQKLTEEQRRRFTVAVRELVEDLRARRPPRPGLRVKGVQGARGIFELTWAPDGRATFEYGDEVSPGQAHVNWRRIGTHDIFKRP